MQNHGRLPATGLVIGLPNRRVKSRRNVIRVLVTIAPLGIRSQPANDKGLAPTGRLQDARWHEPSVGPATRVRCQIRHVLRGATSGCILRRREPPDAAGTRLSWLAPYFQITNVTMA
jgi:hypothetical protein